VSPSASSGLPEGEPEVELVHPVVVGRVQGVFAVHGWLRVLSFARPRENIGHYPCWWLQVDGRWQPYVLREFRAHGNGLLAHLDGIADRERAISLIGAPIAVARDALPPAPPGEYYWADLIGMQVFRALDPRTRPARAGDRIGRVASLLETGAHDVLVVRNGEERLIPFVTDVYVLDVDVERKSIVVDWPD
jgi:16S rRNA processing protein RimM